MSLVGTYKTCFYYFLGLIQLILMYGRFTFTINAQGLTPTQIALTRSVFSKFNGHIFVDECRLFDFSTLD